MPYDPQTNGAAENAVKLFKGTLKAIMLGLERQIEARVPIDHPIVTWMAVYAAQVRTMTVRGSDGKTAHQRARGAPSSTRLLSFGETCRYKARSQKRAYQEHAGHGASAHGSVSIGEQDSISYMTKPWEE